MVSVVMVTELAPGVTATGEKLQEMVEGTPEQENAMGCAKPLDPDIDKLKAADWPEFRLAEAGVAEIAKSGGAALTPVPDSPICCGEPLASSVITSCAVRAPEAAGVNITEIEQSAPTAVGAVHVFF
jgi:hypothetical protein